MTVLLSLISTQLVQKNDLQLIGEKNAGREKS